MSVKKTNKLLGIATAIALGAGVLTAPVATAAPKKMPPECWSHNWENYKEWHHHCMEPDDPEVPDDPDVPIPNPEPDDPEVPSGSSGSSVLIPLVVGSALIAGSAAISGSSGSSNPAPQAPAQPAPAQPAPAAEKPAPEAKPAPAQQQAPAAKPAPAQATAPKKLANTGIEASDILLLAVLFSIAGGIALTVSRRKA